MNFEPASIHRLKNQLAIILGFCELLLAELPDGDQTRHDVLRIQEAGKKALGELPPLPGYAMTETDTPTEMKHGD